MNDIVTALGLVLVIEGLLYSILPEQAKRLMVMASQTSSDTLRAGGLLAVGTGVVVVWLAKSVLAAS
jgi:hypothetical protein